MRAIVSVLSLWVIAFGIPAAAVAAGVTIDGTDVQNVVERNHHLLVPFRAPMEQLGATVTFANPTATATMNGSELVKVDIGNVDGSIQGHPHQLTVPPELVSGLAYVPVEMLGDISRATVVYSDDRTSATVTNFDLAGVEAVGSGGASEGLDTPWLWVFLLPISAVIAAFGFGAATQQLRRTQRPSGIGAQRPPPIRTR